MINSEQEHKRKLKRLELCTDRAERLDLKVWDEEIAQLTIEIEAFEEEIETAPHTIVGLLQFHLDRTGLEQKKMAKAMGFSNSHFSRILNEKAKPSVKDKDKIMNFNYNSLNYL